MLGMFVTIVAGLGCIALFVWCVRRDFSRVQTRLIMLVPCGLLGVLIAINGREFKNRFNSIDNPCLSLVEEAGSSAAFGAPSSVYKESYGCTVYFQHATVELMRRPFDSMLRDRSQFLENVRELTSEPRTLLAHERYGRYGSNVILMSVGGGKAHLRVNASDTDTAMDAATLSAFADRLRSSSAQLGEWANKN